MSVSIDVDQAIADNLCLRYLMRRLSLRARRPPGVRVSPPIDERFRQRNRGNTALLLTHMGTSTYIWYNRLDLKSVWKHLPPAIALPADEALWPTRVKTCIYNATGLPIGTGDFTYKLIEPSPPNRIAYLEIVADEKCYGWYGTLRIPVHVTAEIGSFLENRILGRLPMNCPAPTDIGQYLPGYNLGDLPPPTADINTYLTSPGLGSLPSPTTDINAHLTSRDLGDLPQPP